MVGTSAEAATGVLIMLTLTLNNDRTDTHPRRSTAQVGSKLHRMTTSPEPTRPRLGLAISAIVLGVIAAAMMLGFWLVGSSSDGQGLTTAAVFAVFSYWLSPVIGGVAVLLGVAAIIFSRPRPLVLGAIGIILGAVPIVVVAFSASSLAG